MSASTSLTGWQRILYTNWYWVIIGGVALAVSSIVIRLLLHLLDFRRISDQKAVFIELTPPALRDKSSLATEQLFSVLHGLEDARPILDKVMLRKVVLSLEVASSRSQGIRYIAKLSARDAAMFTQSMTAYLPDVRLTRIKDYLPPAKYSNKQCRIMSFKQSGHFAYPLENHSSLGQHDPIAYLTSTMTKLRQDEMIAFQLVISPASVHEARRIVKQILDGHNARSKIVRRHTASASIKILILLIRIPLYVIAGVVHGILYGHGRPKINHQVNPARMFSPAEEELVATIHRKLSQPLFRVDIRALVIAETKQSGIERAVALRSSLASFTNSNHQSLKARSGLMGRYRQIVFNNRLPSILQAGPAVLSASELAGLFHFPNSLSAKTENIIKSLSKTLPAPVSLKNGTKLDILLGENHYHGSTTPIGLTAAERDRHVYIIGGTGNGKTTMLGCGIVQDMVAGKGVAVVDPHGDLAETLLRYVPEDRVKDVIYFNPRDIAHPVGLNLLEQPIGLSEDDLLLEQDFITEGVVSVFRKIFSDEDHGGHRIEHFLRNTIHTAFTVPDATLFTVYKLLTNSPFRRSVTTKLTDEDLIDFWKSEFNKAGDYQKVKMSSGVNAKLGRFQRSVVSRRVLEQPHSTIDFDDIIQNNKILICNFSKGHIGEDTSALLGISVLTKLQLAALRRSRLGYEHRTPFYLYVDEFQNFATLSFVQLLSEARKYKLFLTMAEQSTSQQEESRLVNIILANVGTVVCFRSGSPADENLLLPLFRPYIEKGEIANLPAYSFYSRIAAIQPQEPLSGQTVLLDGEGSKQIARQVIAASRKQYAIKYSASKKQPVPMATQLSKSAIIEKMPAKLVTGKQAVGHKTKREALAT